MTVITHRSIVSLGYKLSGALVGAPAVIACVGLTIAAIDLHRAAAPDGAHMVSVRAYGLLGFLDDIGVGVDHTFGFLAGLAAWLIAGLAILALLVALWAGLVYLIGRGVGRGAMWARIVGGVFAICLALASFSAIFSLPHRLIAVALPPLALALYTLWVLIWRYRGAESAARLSQSPAMPELAPVTTEVSPPGTV